MIDAVADLLSDPAEGVAPRAGQVTFLEALGVPRAAIVRPWCARVGRMIFGPGWRYQPSPMGLQSFVFAVIGSEGIVDLAAWHPRTGQIGTRLGLGGLLGEAQLDRDGLGTTGMPAPVWSTPIGWLRAERRGVVIVDAEIAAHRLAGLCLQAEDVAHGRNLRGLLELPRPFIVVAAPSHERAAA